MRGRISAFVFLALLVALPLAAGSSSASLAISVQVIPRTILTIDSQPATVDIASADIARGYVDLPDSVAFHVRSNAANGYEIEFQPLASPFSDADVTWGSGLAEVGTDGAWLAEPYQAGTTTGSFTVRLRIAAGTQPGSYPWPVRFTAGSF